MSVSKHHRRTLPSRLSAIKRCRFSGSWIRLRGIKTTVENIGLLSGVKSLHELEVTQATPELLPALTNLGQIL